MSHTRVARFQLVQRKAEQKATIPNLQIADWSDEGKLDYYRSINTAWVTYYIKFCRTERLLHTGDHDCPHRTPRKSVKPFQSSGWHSSNKVGRRFCNDFRQYMSHGSTGAQHRPGNIQKSKLHNASLFRRHLKLHYRSERWWLHFSGTHKVGSTWTGERRWEGHMAVLCNSSELIQRQSAGKWPHLQINELLSMKTHWLSPLPSPRRNWYNWPTNYCTIHFTRHFCTQVTFSSEPWKKILGRY